jgi:hypothetical protein
MKKPTLVNPIPPYLVTRKSRLVNEGDNYMNQVIRTLCNIGLALTDPQGRERIRDRFEDISETASEKYDDLVDRLGRAGRVVRGESDNHIHVTEFLVGIGVGVGLGILFAPASGEETRSAISDKVQDFGGNVRNTYESRRPTGTEGRPE